MTIGPASDIVGSVRHISGSVSDIVGSVGHVTGSVSDIVGSVSDTVGSVRHISGSVSDTVGSVRHISGSVSDTVGSVRHVTGSASDIVGSVRHVTGSASDATGPPPHPTGPALHTAGAIPMVPSGRPAPGADVLAATFNPGVEADQLLGILAWCASAAGVGGVITVGMLMALQLRRGDPGEGGEHARGLFFVLLACVLASTAGPLVEFLGPLSL